MHPYRQNILNKQSNTPNNNPFQEYGIGRLKQRFIGKGLTKSKSHKDVLIAKDKKLTEFFKIQNKNHSNHFTTNLQKKNAEKIHPKLILIPQKKQKADKTIEDEQCCFYNLKTSYFRDSNEIGNHIKLKKQQNINICFDSTLESDRVEARLLKQKLKKSTSMKNLIEQRFLCQTKQKTSSKKIQDNINARENDYYPLKQYDSSKYNWRLSRSKQKLRNKSLSALQSKAKLICELNRNTENKNKLSLGVSKENFHKKPIPSSKDYVQKQSQQNQKVHDSNFNNHYDKLAYTFGSDVVNSINIQ